MHKTIFAKASAVTSILGACATFSMFAISAGATAKPKLLEKGTAIEGAPPVFLYELENKMRVLVLPDGRNPLAAMRLILDAGALRDQKGKTGLAHFFEHMMFRKTKSTQEGHFDRTLAGVGGRGNASTAPGWVEYETTFPGPAFSSILELERQRFRELDMKEPYFSIEKGAVISERRLRYENDPGARGQEILQGKIESGSSFEWQGIGSKADIENMKLEDAAAFNQNHYVPENTILSVGGPFQEGEIVEKVSAAFSSWKAPLKKQKIEIPADYFKRNIGKKFICGAAVFDKTIQMNFPNADKSYENGLYLNVFQLLLNKHPEGTLAYRFQKEKLGQNIAPYQVSWQKESVPYRVYFKLSKEDSFDKAAEFFWKETDRVLAMSYTSEIFENLSKEVQTEEAQLASRMTSLLEMYQGNLYEYGNLFVSKGKLAFFKSVNTSKLHGWIKSRFSKDNYYTFGVVPSGQAELCEKNVEGK